MYVRIGNLPPDTTVEEIREYVGDSPEFQDIKISNEGNAENVVAFLQVDTTHAGAEAIAEAINDSFYKERRLNAFAMTLMHE